MAQGVPRAAALPEERTARRRHGRFGASATFCMGRLRVDNLVTFVPCTRAVRRYNAAVMRDALAQACIDLAVALRWAHRYGLSEGVCNYFSLVAPGAKDRFLINPRGLHWSEITPADILLVDAAGDVVEGRHTVEPTACYIHSRLHRSKRAPACVMHTHMPYATTLTLLESGRLEPASQNALRFYGRIAYDEEFNGPALEEAEGDRIAARLNGADVLFLQHHGVIVCGESVANAFDDLYYLDRETPGWAVS